MKGLILLILGTDHITAVTGTDHITAVTGGATAQDMPLTQAPLQSRLATGGIILAALVITWAAPITSGGQGTGDGGTVKKSGSTAITSCEDTDGVVFRSSRYLNDWLRKTPPRQPETQSGCHAAQAVAHASAKID